MIAKFMHATLNENLYPFPVRINCLIRFLTGGDELEFHCKRGVLAMFGERQGIIVYLHTLKQAKMLRKFGNIHYVSKKLKYAVLYTNMEDVEALSEKLRSYSFVKRVELSYKPFLKMEYENSKPDKAKEYDYKMGI